MSFLSTYGRDSYRGGKEGGNKVPKVVRCNAGVDEPAMYKNLGNSNRIKFMWVESVTISGTTEEFISAGEFGGGKAVDQGLLGVDRGGRDSYLPGADAYGKTIADLHFWPVALAAPAGRLWIDVDTVGDTVTLTSTAGETNLEVDILVFSS